MQTLVIKSGKYRALQLRSFISPQEFERNEKEKEWRPGIAIPTISFNYENQNLATEMSSPPTVGTGWVLTY